LPKKSKPPAKGEQPPSFEESLEDLAAIVEQLESGELGLNDALGKYEQGVKLLKQCHQKLEKVERRIELLSGFDAEGNPVTEAFDDESSLEKAASGEARSRRPQAKKPDGGRRKRSGGGGHAVDDGDSLF